MFIFILLAIAFTGWFLNDIYESINIPENPTVEELELVTIEYHKLIRYLTIANFIGGLIFSPIFIHIGYRTLKHREFPPPGTAVLVRSKIAKGKMVLIGGIGSLFCGVFVWIGFVVCLVAEYLIYEFI